MELFEFTGKLWMHINHAIKNRYISGAGKSDPDVILVSYERLKEMRAAIGEMHASYDPQLEMLKYRGIRILPDPSKGNDDFEILYNAEK